RNEQCLKVAAFHPSERLEFLAKRRETRPCLRIIGRPIEPAYPLLTLLLLRAGRERPRRRAAKQSDELAPPHRLRSVQQTHPTISWQECRIMHHSKIDRRMVAEQLSAQCGKTCTHDIGHSFVVSVGNNAEQFLHTFTSNRRHDAKFGKMSSDRID